MLSVETCKSHLPRGIYTDEELTQVIENLHSLAELLVDKFLSERKASHGK